MDVSFQVKGPLIHQFGNIDGAQTAVSKMYSQGLIDTPIVGFLLARESDGMDSQMTIGDK
jgi:hypothetical protein